MCDTEDDTKRNDFGTIMDKATLPINQVFNGDTGGIDEYAAINVGQLICSGNGMLMVVLICFFACFWRNNVSNNNTVIRYCNFITCLN